jgi:hypothetical protein
LDGLDLHIRMGQNLEKQDLGKFTPLAGQKSKGAILAFSMGQMHAFLFSPQPQSLRLEDIFV